MKPLAFIATALIAFAPPPSNAQILDDPCVAPREGRLFRQVKNEDASIWIAEQDRTTSNICIATSQCRWKLNGARTEDLGSLARLALGETCGGRQPSFNLFYRSDCSLSGDVAKQFSGTIFLAGNLKACASTAQPDNALLIASLSDKPLLLQASIGNDTLAMFLAKLRMIAVIRRTRVSSESEGAKLYEMLQKSLAAEENWLAVEHDGNGFATSLAQQGNLQWEVGQKSVIWGALDTGYVSMWLQEIRKLSSNDQLAFLVETDPLPSASNTSAVGRLARWFVASLRRLADPEISKLDRDWMTRIALSNPGALSKTIFRREMAIKRAGK